MAFTNRDGFIIAAREKFEADSKTTDEIKREIIRIRRLLEGSHQPLRRGGGPALGGSSPGRTGSAGQGRAPASRSRPASPSGGSSTSGGSSGGAPSMPRPAGREGGATRGGVATPAARGRNKLGQFTGGQRKADPNGGGKSDEESRRGDRQHAELVEAIKGLSEGADGVDPAVSAANEVARAIQPVSRGISKLFGKDPQKQQVGWLRKIWRALTERPNNGSSIPGGAAGGLLSTLLNGPKKLLGFAGPAAAGLLGYLTGKGGAPSAAGMSPGSAKPSLLSRLGKRLAPAGRFSRILGPLAAAFDLGSGYLKDRSIRGDAGLTADQKRDARLANAADTGANLGGHIGGGALGAAIGTAILPGIGTIVGGVLGAAFGPGLIKSVSDTLSPLIGDAVDFVKGLAGKAVELYDKAVAATADGIEAVANSGPVKAISNAYSYLVDKTSQGIEAAANAGKYVIKQGWSVANSVAERFEAVKGSIADAARRVGIDPALFGSVLGFESAGFKTDAKAGTSSAAGLGQFIRSTFIEMLAKHGAKHPETAALASKAANFKSLSKADRQQVLAARNDPVVSALLAAEYQKEGINALLREGAANPSSGEIYSKYVFGTGNKLASAARKNPHMSIPEAVRSGLISQSAINANRSIFDGKNTIADVVSELDRRTGQYAMFGSQIATIAAGPSASASRIVPSTAVPRMSVPTIQKAPDAPRIPMAAAINPIPSPEPAATQDIGQNLSDRLLAHIQTGGIGSKG